MTAFADLGLSKDALKAVERLEYATPTPVQEQAIPIVLEGRDLIAAASTGTGKTAAFLLPILSTLPRAGRGRRAPRVLVVTPTRELAQQISFTCIKIARATGHFATTVYGGTSYSPQIRELRGGTDVLIATPGRLKDLMERGVADLGSIQVLVLDEADRMLDMGFLPDVTDIVEATPKERQTLLFSATIDKSIENNLGSLLRDPAVVQIAHKGETAATVAQFIMPVTQRDKAELLQAVLREKGSERVIVFARTRNRTEECAEMLRDAGFSAESIHSDKSQSKRRRALESFRRGKVDILVATDVLARGIDVTGVDHVINYDLPDMPEDYVHRIGRTGRAGEEGYAISFVSPDTKRLLRDVEKLINREIPLMEMETYELDPSLLAKGGNGGKGGKGRSSRKRGNQRNRSERSASDARRSSGSEGKKRDLPSGKGGKEEFRPKNRKERRAEQFANQHKGGRTNERSTERAEDRFASRKGDRAYDRGGNRSHKSHDKRDRYDRRDRYDQRDQHDRRDNDFRGNENTRRRDNDFRKNDFRGGKDARYRDKKGGQFRNSEGSSYRDRVENYENGWSYGGKNGQSYGRKDSRSFDRKNSRSYDRADNRSKKHDGNRKDFRSFDREENRSESRSPYRASNRSERDFGGRRDERHGNRADHRGSRGKGCAAKRQKSRPANVTDIRSFGEHKERRANKRHVAR